MQYSYRCALAAAVAFACLFTLHHPPAQADETDLGQDATLVIRAENEASEGVNMRGVDAVRADPSCQDRSKVAHTFIKKGTTEATTKPGSLPAGKPILLTFTFVDALRSLNRNCWITVEMTPAHGAKYVATFKTELNVTSCQLALAQQDGAAVDYRVREDVCMAIPRYNLASGQGYARKWFMGQPQAPEPNNGEPLFNRPKAD